MEKTKEILLIVGVVLAVLIVGGGITGAVVGVSTTENYDCEKTVYEDQVVTEYVPLSYSVVNTAVSESGWGIFRPKSRTLNIQVRNNDNVGGLFTATYTINKYSGGTLTDTSSAFIKPYETITISSGGHEFSISSWSYKINAPTKEKLTTRKVSKQVPSICTRNVEKSLWETVLS